MLLWHVTLLSLAWFFIFASESIFPKAHSALDLSTHWVSYLFFKPIPVLFSSMLYVSAVLIIRYVTCYHLKVISGKGNVLKWKVILNLLPTFIAVWQLFIILNKHLFATLITAGFLLIYDVFASFREMRRIKRLKAAFRHSVPKS